MRPFRVAPAGSVLLALVVALATGCGDASAPSTVHATAPGATARPAPSVEPSMRPAPTPSGTPLASPSAAVAVDAALLGLLPAELEGNPVTPVPEAGAEIATDPSIGRDARAVAVAMVVAVDDRQEDFAVASVVELLPGVVDDGFLRDWRESYDAAACEQAGGVTRRAEAEIGGRTTFIATCAGGVRTYHVHVPGPDRIVSITSVGEARLGEQLVAGIEAGS